MEPRTDLRDALIAGLRANQHPPGIARESLAGRWNAGIDRAIEVVVSVFADPALAAHSSPDPEAEEREKAWRAWNETPTGDALIPNGEPCPTCGPEGHGRHMDDSYGGCVTCREYVAHTDDVTVIVPFPCAPYLAAHSSPASPIDVEEDAK